MAGTPVIGAGAIGYTVDRVAMDNELGNVALTLESIMTSIDKLSDRLASVSDSDPKSVLNYTDGTGADTTNNQIAQIRSGVGSMATLSTNYKANVRPFTKNWGRFNH